MADEDDDRRAQAWSIRNRGNAAIREELLSAIDHVAREELDRSGLVLDIGTGVAWLLRALADGVSPNRLVGVDIAEAPLARARAGLPGVRLITADARSLPLDSRSCAVVLLTSVLSGLSAADSGRVLREARRVLEPGGLLIVYDVRVVSRRSDNLRPLSSEELERALGGRVSERRITLAPPIARRLGVSTRVVYPALAAIPSLRSHSLWTFRAPADGDEDPGDGADGMQLPWRRRRRPGLDEMSAFGRYERLGPVPIAGLSPIAGVALTPVSTATALLDPPSIARFSALSSVPPATASIERRRPPPPTRRPATATPERAHVWMFVRNPCTNDQRVLREAAALGADGHEVTILAVHRAGLRERERRAGFEIVRVPIDPVHLAFLRWYRTRPTLRTRRLRARRSLRLRFAGVRRARIRAHRRLARLHARVAARRGAGRPAAALAALTLRGLEALFAAPGAPGERGGIVAALAAGRDAVLRPLAGAAVPAIERVRRAARPVRAMAGRLDARVYAWTRAPRRAAERRNRVRVARITGDAPLAAMEGRSLSPTAGERVAAPLWTALVLPAAALATLRHLARALARLIALLGRVAVTLVRGALFPVESLRAFEAGLRPVTYGWLRRALLTAHKPLLLHDYTRRVLAVVGERLDPELHPGGPRHHIFHAHDLNTVVAAETLARRHGAPFVYDSHELHLEASSATTTGPLRRRLLRLYERRYIRRADRVITVNESLSTVLARRYGIAAPVVVRNVPDPPARPPAESDLLRRDLDVPAGMPIALYHGNIAAFRGLEELIAAAELLPDVAIVMLGNGALRPALEAEIRLRSLADRVFLRDAVPIEQLNSYVASADIGVIPIRAHVLNYYFSLPNKLFELLMAGRPIAAADLPEIRRVVSAYEVGTIFRLDDPPSMAQAIRALLDRPDLERVRARARAAAAENNWPIERERLLAVYRGLAPVPAAP